MEPAATYPGTGQQDDATARAVAAAIARHAQRPGALLPLLHDVQGQLGWLPAECVAPIARALNLSRAEVHGVISFYHHFRRQPPGRHIVQVCQAEACRSRGAEALMAHARTRLGCAERERSADGEFTLQAVYCLGQCASAPAMMIDDRVHARMTAPQFDQVVHALAPAAAVSPDPALRATLSGEERGEGTPAAGSETPPAAALSPLASRDGGLARGTDEASGGSTISPASACVTVYVPRDSTALTVGADEVAASIHRQARALGVPVNLVRNGSRGAFWLEPLVEVDTPEGRVGYGPVAAEDVPSLFATGFLDGGAHPRALGRVDELPWFASQQRLTFARIGRADPLSIADYEARGGFAGLRRALAMAPREIVAEVTDSGLRGRGGAAFPTGLKWQTVAQAPGERRHIVCNADEGDSGSFADRLLMESDPFALIEGMTIAGFAVGAREGWIYLRSEYPHAAATLEAAIAHARARQFLGDDVLGSGRAFDIELRLGAGSYVCGEETAMLESLEGRRGIVRAKPPLPAVAGLFGQPTVVNNVVTLATVPLVLARGAAFHRDFGAGRSRGTLALQLAGNVARGGLVEVAFGLTLRQLVETYGGGTATGRPIRAIQVGGPLGTYVPPQHWDTPLEYEGYAALGHLIGHGSVVVHDDTADLAQLARFAMRFCAQESCGKCTPCRIGSVRGVEIIDRIVAGRDRQAHIALLRELAETMTHGSLCAMGAMTPLPVLSALNHYPEDFGAGVEHARD